jgi:hypothetical protein
VQRSDTCGQSGVSSRLPIARTGTEHYHEFDPVRRGSREWAPNRGARPARSSSGPSGPVKQPAPIEESDHRSSLLNRAIPPMAARVRVGRPQTSVDRVIRVRARRFLRWATPLLSREEMLVSRAVGSDKDATNRKSKHCTKTREIKQGRLRRTKTDSRP